MLSHISLIDHGSGHFLKSPILSFYNSILLWSSRTREIMSNTIFFEINLKEFILKFATMITSDLYDFAFLLRLNLSAEVKEHIMRLILVFQELYPCPSAIVDYDDYSIFLSSD